jgi:hypothetical protein
VAAGKDVIQHTHSTAFTLPPNDFLTGKTNAQCLASQCRQFDRAPRQISQLDNTKPRTGRFSP